MANKFCIISLIVLFHINVIYLTLLGKFSNKFTCTLIFLIHFSASVMIVYYTEVYNKTTNLTCSNSESAKFMIHNIKSCYSTTDCEQNFTKGSCLYGTCVY